MPEGDVRRTIGSHYIHDSRLKPEPLFVARPCLCRSGWTTGYTVGGSVGAATGITFDGYKYDYNSTLDLPTISYSPSIFGPNFQYADVAVPIPEPTTMMIIIAGALLLPFRASTLRMLRKNRTA